MTTNEEEMLVFRTKLILFTVGVSLGLLFGVVGRIAKIERILTASITNGETK